MNVNYRKMIPYSIDCNRLYGISCIFKSNMIQYIGYWKGGGVMIWEMALYRKHI